MAWQRVMTKGDVADAISQFIIWTYEQNPEVKREEVTRGIR